MTNKQLIEMLFNEEVHLGNVTLENVTSGLLIKEQENNKVLCVCSGVMPIAYPNNKVVHFYKKAIQNNTRMYKNIKKVAIEKDYEIRIEEVL